AALIGTALIGIFGVRFFITEKVPLDVPPDALAVNARNMLRDLGYTAKPGDSEWGLENNGEYLRYVRPRQQLATERWKNPGVGEPPLMIFWYRQSPDALSAEWHTNTTPTEWDPPMTRSGMVRVYTDPQGHLRKFDAIPREVDRNAGPAQAFDWALLFRAAGLDESRYQPANPEWSPQTPFDQRAAWTGSDPQTNAPLRVEAAAWRGKPVFFQVIGPWSDAVRDRAAQIGDPLVLVVLKFASLAVALMFAWRNVRSGKADLQGAWKLGILYFSAMSLATLLMANHRDLGREFDTIWSILANGVGNALALCG